MNWIQSMQNAINYIEKNILDDLNIDKIAENVYSSSANFHRIFSIVTGITIGDYIRNRRLTLAGQELYTTKEKVINIAIKYGYETAESFTKAFIRFHDVTPSTAKKFDEYLKCFAPLSIQIDIRGGFGMNRKMIPNIPMINNYGNEVDYVINLLEATFTGTGKRTDKAELAAYSGMGNRFCWTDGKWMWGNEGIGSLNVTPFEAEVRLLKTIGWEARYITVHRDKDGNPLNTDDDQIKRDFVDAIDRGYPVLIQYIKNGRYNIIIGYEDDGSKIISKDYVETTGVHTDSETVVRENWQHSIAEYILLKEKTEPTQERGRVIDLFRMIVSHARRTDEIKGRKAGFAAWESYLHMIEHDDFSECTLLAKDAPPINGMAQSVEHRWGIYCDGLCQIFGRIEPLPYYRSLAEKFPEWREELEAAVSALDVCANYAGFWKKVGFTFDKAGYEKFRDPAVRKILADEGRKAMQKDMEAIEQLEKILAKEGL